MSLLTGLRTEEVRALRWDHVVAWVEDQWQPVSEAGFDHEQLVELAQLVRPARDLSVPARMR